MADLQDLGRDDFLRLAAEPNVFPDERMDFHLRRGDTSDPERGFSVEGFDTVAAQMESFAMARTLAFYRREGRMPTGVRAELHLVFDDDRSNALLARQNEDPWYALTDGGETKLPTLDGTNRGGGLR